MGRTVSTHRHAIETIYLHDVIEDDGGDGWAWGTFMEDLQHNVLPEIFPSLVKCDRWKDRENHVIMENGRCEISVSEYCGCVAVCLAPLDADKPLDVAWCERCSNSFRLKMHTMFPESAMVRMGGFSNGESVYQKIG